MAIRNWQVETLDHLFVFFEYFSFTFQVDLIQTVNIAHLHVYSLDDVEQSFVTSWHIVQLLQLMQLILKFNQF